jgi:DegV family protein with EDD domain
MIKIIADTTSCIPPKQAAEMGIPYLPQIIVFGEESYRDDTEITVPQFLEKLKSSSIMPKTSAPAPELYRPIYEEFAAQGHTMIVLVPSAEVSGTLRGATVAAQEFPEADIRIIDTRTIAAGLGSLVLEAWKWAHAGLDADSIVSRILALSKREHVYFVVDTLEYLYKNGRIGAAKALFGSILQVKPILTLTDGKVAPFESQRTQRKARARLQELVLELCPHSADSLIKIQHGSALDEAQAMAEEFKEKLGIPEIPIYDLPPAILTHAGPGVISASFFVSD